MTLSFHFRGRFFYSLSLGVALLLSASPLGAGSPSNPGPLAQRLDRILQNSALKHAEVGILVRSLSRQQNLYEKNSYQALNPASTQKIVTTVSALKSLGPNYRFKTGFFTNRQWSDGRIDNLYVQGGGDPLLVIERLWRICGDLHNQGLREISGNIVIDSTFFDGESFAQGWPDRPGPQAYFAPTAALSVNFNSVLIYVRPALKPGEPPKVVMDPQVDGIKLQVSAQTTSNGVKKIHIEKVEQSSGDVFRVSGQIPVGAEPVLRYRNVSHPSLYAGEILKQLLENRGILVKGKIEKGKLPKNAVEIFTEESPPLATLIKEVNKLSNNFMAEQILKTMAAELYGTPGTTDKGVDHLEKFLAGLHIPKGEYHLENGSGLSRKSRMSAHALVRVLEEAWEDQEVHPEFLSSLALGGLDGTLEIRRLNASDRTTSVRAKTGSLKNVSCITGYVTRLDGEVLAFTILMNDLGKSSSLAHLLQDQIIGALKEIKG